MKKILFICTHCEAVRPVLISEVDSYYAIGNCTACKSKIVINRKRLRKSAKVAK